ncbi:MAG TPA: response regulator transcription factor [Bacteroidetes bacterium]|nr:response regulator transcription factor [Bacteroidota bacterium]
MNTSPTISCLVIDDEPVARKGIAGYVEQTSFLSLAGTCKSALEANDFLRQQPVDLLFLDIQMPDLTGTDFVRSLENPPAVIFTTAYREYAIDGFELNALDYLVKPISFQRFLKSANKALTHFELINKQESDAPVVKEQDHFFIKSDGRFIKIKLDDVLYFESEKDYVFIYTKQKRYLILISLKQLEKELPPENFLRVHRSFLVSLDKVELMENHKLVIQDKKIPVSRSLQETIYNRLIKGKLWRREL